MYNEVAFYIVTRVIIIIMYIVYCLCARARLLLVREYIYNILYNSILYRTHRYYIIYKPDAHKYCFDIVLNIIVVCHIIPTYARFIL